MASSQEKSTLEYTFGKWLHAEDYPSKNPVIETPNELVQAPKLNPRKQFDFLKFFVGIFNPQPKTPASNQSLDLK